MKPVHALTLAEAQEALAAHLPAKPETPWSSILSEAWRERKALLELWILLESRHQAEPQGDLPTRRRKPRRAPARRNRRFRVFGVIA